MTTAPGSETVRRRGVEGERLLAALSVVCLAFALLLAGYVADGGARNPFDAGLSSSLQSLRTPSGDLLMLTASYLCSWPIVVAGGVLTIAFFLILRRWLHSLIMLASLVGNVLVNSAIKGLVRRPRPDQAHALLPAFGTSFPSGHTFSAFAFYGLVAVFALAVIVTPALRRVVVLTTVFFIALVGISRVYVGAHWPTDVLGSCFLGTALLACVSIYAKRSPTPAAVKTIRLPATVLTLAWLVFVVGFALVHPITESVGALGDPAASD